MPFRVTRKAGLLACLSRAASYIGAAMLCLLGGANSLQNATAEGETRSLTMHHMHTGEDITITYKKNGRYDDDALLKINHFLRDWRREQEIRMDPHLLDVIWEVYREVDAKDPVQVVCGYRSPETNAMLRRRSHGVAQFSQHMLGRAMDFYIPGVPLEQIRFAGLRLERGGVGFYPTSGSPFVHLDTGNVRHWPRMTHDQLVRVFPDGKTVHIPSDGRPLARYAVALAEIQRRGGSASATSLAEAQSAGAITESDGQTEKPKRGLLARLFGIKEPDEDAEEAQAATNAPLTPPAPRASTPAKPQLASVVPLPPVHLGRSKGPAQPGPLNTYALASATVSPTETPAEIVRSRVDWNAPPPSPTGTDVAASADPGVTRSKVAWTAGTQGQGSTDAESVIPPRPPQPIDGADASSEATTTIGPWSVATRNDRVPTELALAYAATPSTLAASPTSEPPRRATPLSILGAARAAPPTAAPTLPLPPAPSKSTSVATEGHVGERITDPWLRGVVMAPSVQASMTVAVMGPIDYRNLQPLMQKPYSALALHFSDDPAGVGTESFAGSAVAFLPTVTFTPAHTASLN